MNQLRVDFVTGVDLLIRTSIIKQSRLHEYGQAVLCKIQKRIDSIPSHATTIQGDEIAKRENGPANE